MISSFPPEGVEISLLHTSGGENVIFFKMRGFAPYNLSINPLNSGNEKVGKKKIHIKLNK